MLDRKNFIKSISLATGFTLFNGFGSFAQIISKHSYMGKIIPKKLKKGDTIGLITPAGVITEEQLLKIVKKVKKLGFKSYFKESITAEYGYFAGTDKERAEELNQMFANKDVDAIMCARGGYGAIRMLDLVDYDLIKKNPKIFVGYSDITALLSSIYEKTGLVCFHGPMGVSTFDDFTVESFENILMKSQNHYKYPYLREEETENNPEFDFYTINGGKAEGELTGGNMSVLVSMIGSKFEPNYKNKLVYLEEIDEKTYKIDRMLIQMLQASNLSEAAGIVLGVFKDCNGDKMPTFTLQEAITKILKPLNIPTVYGFPFGHVVNKFTIPEGARAKLNANKKTLKLIEKTVD